jgi:hypothetical protein
MALMKKKYPLICLMLIFIHCAIPFDKVERYPAIGNASTADIFIRVVYENKKSSQVERVVPNNSFELEHFRSPIAFIEILDSLSVTKKKIDAKDFDLSRERVQKKNEIWVIDENGFHVVSRTNRGWLDSYRENLGKAKSNPE